MWRELVAVILAGATLHAQAKATNPNSQTKVPAKPVPRIETYQRYNELRQGMTEDAGVILIVNGSLTSPRSPVTGILPVSVTLDPEPGLTCSKVSYPKPYPVKFVYRADQIMAHSGFFPIEMKLSATKNAPVGLHLMHGKFRYQEITKDGPSAVQEMDVAIPVTVVPHHAQISKTTDWPFYHMPAAEIVGLVMLCIVLLPIMIALMPLYLICLFEWGCE